MIRIMYNKTKTVAQVVYGNTQIGNRIRFYSNHRGWEIDFEDDQFKNIEAAILHVILNSHEMENACEERCWADSSFSLSKMTIRSKFGTTYSLITQGAGDSWDLYTIYEDDEDEIEDYPPDKLITKAYNFHSTDCLMTWLGRTFYKLGWE